MDEVVLFAPDGSQVPAASLSYNMSSTWEARSADRCFDGVTDQSDGATGCQTSNLGNGDPRPTLAVSFPCPGWDGGGSAAAVMSKVKVYNRVTNGQGSLRDFKLRVLSPSGQAVATYMFNSADMVHTIGMAVNTTGCGDTGQEAVDGVCLPRCSLAGYSRSPGPQTCACVDQFLCGAEQCPDPNAAVDGRLVFSPELAENSQFQGLCWDRMFADLASPANGFKGTTNATSAVLSYKTVPTGSASSDSMFITHRAAQGALVRRMDFYRRTPTDPVITTIIVTFTSGDTAAVGPPLDASHTRAGTLILSNGERIAEVRVWMTSAALDDKGRPQLSGVYFKTTYLDPSSGQMVSQTVDIKPPGAATTSQDLRLDTLPEGPNSRGSGILLGVAAMSLMSSAGDPVSINQVSFVFLAAPQSASLAVDMDPFTPSMATVTPVALQSSSVQAPALTSATAVCSSATIHYRKVNAVSAGDIRALYETMGFQLESGSGGFVPASSMVNTWDITTILESLVTPGVKQDISQTSSVGMESTLTSAKDVNTSGTRTTLAVTFTVLPGFTGQCVTTYSMAKLQLPYTATLTLAFDAAGAVSWSAVLRGTYTGAETSGFKNIVILRPTNSTARRTLLAASPPASALLSAPSPSPAAAPTPPGVIVYKLPARVAPELQTGSAVSASGAPTPAPATPLSQLDPDLRRHLTASTNRMFLTRPPVSGGRRLHQQQGGFQLSPCCSIPKRAVSFKSFKAGVTRPANLTVSLAGSCSCTMSNVTTPVVLKVQNLGTAGVTVVAQPSCWPPAPVAVLNGTGSSGAGALVFSWTIWGAAIAKEKRLVLSGQKVSLSIGQANYPKYPAGALTAGTTYNLAVALWDTNGKYTSLVTKLIVPGCFVPKNCKTTEEAYEGRCVAKCTGGSVRGTSGACMCTNLSQELYKGACVAKCTGNTFRATTGACVCKAGFGTSKCTACIGNTYSLGGTLAACPPCPTGKKTNVGKTTCAKATGRRLAH